MITNKMITNKMITNKMITKKQDKSKNKVLLKSKIKKTIKKQNNNIIKHIYIKSKFGSCYGFGNKVYYLIFAIYIYNLYNKHNKHNKHNNKNSKCIIHYVLCKSSHDKYNDPQMHNIFPKSKIKINFITENHYNTINKKHKLLILPELQDLQNLSAFPKYEDLSQYNEISNNFKLVYEMYKTFTKQDKDIFTMNTDILTDKDILNNIISNPYSLVHIRYGDKLHFLKHYINKPDVDIKKILNDKIIINDIDRFILYTPEYYIDKINELLKKTPTSMNVYIITDSATIVKQFIMNNHSFKNNSRIILLDKMTWWDSFYLLYYASNIILSSSTFCFAGAYFNKKRANCELLLYHYDYTNPNISPEEYAISPYWKIISERKYILNYNSKIAYEILKFKYNWTY
jgi:hypothetical protein